MSELFEADSWSGWLAWFFGTVGRPKDFPDPDSDEGILRYEPWRNALNATAAGSKLDHHDLMAGLERATNALVTEATRTRTGAAEGFGAGIHATLFQDLDREFRRQIAPKTVVIPENPGLSGAELEHSNAAARAHWAAMTEEARDSFRDYALRRFPFVSKSVDMTVNMAMGLAAWPDEFAPWNPAAGTPAAATPEQIKAAKARAIAWREALPDNLRRVYNALPVERRVEIAHIAAAEERRATARVLGEPRPPSIEPTARFAVEMRLCRAYHVLGRGWPTPDEIDEALAVVLGET